MSVMNIPEVKPKTMWRHSSGRVYKVLLLANEHTTRPKEYPITVVYEGYNGHIWSRPLSDWHRSFVPKEEAV